VIDTSNLILTNYQITSDISLLYTYGISFNNAVSVISLV